KFASAQEGPMVRRGSGGGTGVGAPPHAIPTPCQYVRRRLRRTQKSAAGSAGSAGRKKAPDRKKHVDSMLIPCYDVDERRTLTKRKETMNVKKLPLYRLIARAGKAASYCEKNGNKEWQQAWEELLEKCEELLPSGSGIDAANKNTQASASTSVMRT